MDTNLKYDLISTSIRKHKIKRILDLLRFVLTLDDQEIIKSTIESVIEELEEDLKKPKK